MEELDSDRKTSVPEAGSKNLEGPVLSVAQEEGLESQQIRERAKRLGDTLDARSQQQVTSGGTETPEQKALAGILKQDAGEINKIATYANPSGLEKWDESLKGYEQKYNGSPESEAALQEQVGRHIAALEQQANTLEQHRKFLDEFIEKAAAQRDALSKNNLGWQSDQMHQILRELDRIKRNG